MPFSRITFPSLLLTLSDFCETKIGVLDYWNRLFNCISADKRFVMVFNGSALLLNSDSSANSTAAAAAAISRVVLCGGKLLRLWSTNTLLKSSHYNDCEPTRYRSHNDIKLAQLLFGCLTRIYVMDYFSLLALQIWRLSSGGGDLLLRLSECAWWDWFLMLCLQLLFLSKLIPLFSCDWYIKFGQKSNALWEDLSNQKAMHCGNA